jgi:hypothetical protein
MNYKGFRRKPYDRTFDELEWIYDEAVFDELEGIYMEAV